MYESKVEIEKFFQDFWLNTPVQYQGSDFEGTNSWISLVFIPILRESNTCQRTFSTSMLKVFCYDENPTQAIKLMDSVNQFFDCKQLNVCHSSTGTPSGEGVIDLNNNTYETLTTFEINKIV